MKKIIPAIIVVLFLANLLHAQGLVPTTTIEVEPNFTNMHIASDGKSYYVINGGDAKVGKISSYGLNGNLIKHYSFPLDMRGIMYSKKTKSLYVNTIDKKIFRIIDLTAGTYELVYSDLYEEKQSSLVLDPKGKFLYAFNTGNLVVINFKKGEVVKNLAGLKCGKTIGKGAGTVAVDDDYIYTWDASSKEVYAYDKEGKFKKSFILQSGDFGYSLSFANGFVFVSQNKKNKKGFWYGYKLW